MKMKGHEGSLGEYFMQPSGSDAQGHRNENIFCKVASKEWELGMCVAWLRRWVRGSDTLVLVSQRPTSAGTVYPPPVNALSFFFLKLNVYFFLSPAY